MKADNASVHTPDPGSPRSDKPHEAAPLLCDLEPIPITDPCGSARAEARGSPGFWYRLLVAATCPERRLESAGVGQVDISIFVDIEYVEAFLRRERRRRVGRRLRSGHAPDKHRVVRQIRISVPIGIAFDRARRQALVTSSGFPESIEVYPSQKALFACRIARRRNLVTKYTRKAIPIRPFHLAVDLIVAPVAADIADIGPPGWRSVLNTLGERARRGGNVDANVELDALSVVSWQIPRGIVCHEKRGRAKATRKTLRATSRRGSSYPPRTCNSP